MGDCLETMAQTMNQKYSITTDYHAKVIDNMEALEQKVFRPADISKNFDPPKVAGADRIIQALKGETIEAEEGKTGK